MPKTVEERLIEKGVDPDFLKVALEKTAYLTQLLTEIKEENDANLEEERRNLEIIQNAVTESTLEYKEKELGFFSYTNLTPDEITALAGVPAAMDHAESLVNKAKSRAAIHSMKDKEKYNRYDDTAYNNPGFYSKNNHYEAYGNDYAGYENEYNNSYDDRHSR